MNDAPGYPSAYLVYKNFKIEFSKVFFTENGLKGSFEIQEEQND
ncbi:hypothetical protein [Leptospira yasudae]